jgi:hypothetical protein
MMSEDTDKRDRRDYGIDPGPRAVASKLPDQNVVATPVMIDVSAPAVVARFHSNAAIR